MISRRAAITAGLALTALGARATAAPAPETTRVVLKAPDGRAIRVSIWEPPGRQRGVILFSHGALSSPESYQRVLGPWAQAGFKIFAPLHPDSTIHPAHDTIGKTSSWMARLVDMRVLADFVGAPAYVAAGHSYGGLTALTLGGAAAEIPEGVTGPLRDRRATSVVALSPPGPTPTLISAAGFGGLAVPAIIQTGDRDAPPGPKGGDWHVHLAAYDAAPAGDKYALVLDGADHYFGGLICKLDLPGPPQTEPLERAVRISTDFLEAYGASDGAAHRRLARALSASGPAKLTRK